MMLERIWGIDIPCRHDPHQSNSVVSVDIFNAHPTLIDICTPSGGTVVSVHEAREVIAALQRAIEAIEGKAS